MNLLFYITVVLLAIDCVYLTRKVYELELLVTSVLASKIKDMSITITDTRDDKSEDE